MPTLTGLRFPIPWREFDLPDPLQTQSTVVTNGEIGWAWGDVPPDFPVPSCETPPGTPAAGWNVDHVVLLVPDLDAAITRMEAIGCEPRLRVTVRTRATAFFRVGPVLEVIESPVRQAALYGIAFVTDEPLDVVALRWRALGKAVTDPRAAIQPGRRILTVRSVQAGFAVMSPDRPVAASAG